MNDSTILSISPSPLSMARAEILAPGGAGQSAAPSAHAAVRVGTLAGWGRVPVVPAWEDRSEDLASLTADVPLTRGCGRAYGDASLPAPGDFRVAGSTLANRIVAFDPLTGGLRAEAGLTLDEVYRTFLPRGFFTPVTPGTRFVTLGGMVACDVHGKNHHRDGCFGQHVTSIRMRVANGAIVDCSPTEHADLFWSTVGGMGLTGHVLEVAFRLARVPSPWIYQETERVGDIDQFIEALKTAGPHWPMTVGWIDCLATGSALGRGVLYKGRWAAAAEAPRRFPSLRPPMALPFTLPSGLLTPSLMRALNGGYYAAHGLGKRSAVVHPKGFFYPLDVVGHWNRLYGRRGFAQYQCVLPEAGGHGSARRFLRLSRAAAALPSCV